MENSLSEWAVDFYGGFAVREDSEGFMTLSLPHWGNSPELVPFIAIEDDYGDIVHGILLDPYAHDKQVIQSISDICSFDELTEIYNKGSYW